MKKNSLALLAVIFVFALTALALSRPIAAKSENANSQQGRDTETSAGPSGLPGNSASPYSTPSPSSENKGRVTAQGHRSVVANFVQTLLQAANREQGGLGEQVRVIAQQQNQAEDTTTEAITKVEKRSKIAAFLLGSDYKNLGALRGEIVQTRNRIRQLSNLATQAKNASSTSEIQSQIQTMEQEQTKIENFVQTQENKFSLFGWLVKLFQ